MVAPPYVTFGEGEVTYGRVVPISALVRRVIAENPSKFTYLGTGTYIVGSGDVAVIDPGPVLDSHRDALAAALDGERVRAICITHCHSDHSPLAAWLRDETGAPTVGFGPHPPPAPIEPADRDTDADASHDEGDDEIDDGVTVEETLDLEFDPDVRVVDGELAAAGHGWTLTALHTPGHTSNHTCYALAEERGLFTGDHVMGWSTTVVSPPDGDMAAYIASLRDVARRDDAVLWPTHGPPVTDPRPYVAALVEHRLEREAQVLDAVRRGVTDIAAIVEELYADVRRDLHKPARRSVLAHLVKLIDDGLVITDGTPRLRSSYHPA
jgi:glyoxylase-like metal-dependent hydrolase (beta-lactamase superfamily II)